MEIIEYDEKYANEFIALNLAWIEKHFKVEPEDRAMLYRAGSYIAKGAMIYFAVEDGRVLATCMAVPQGDGVWEMCKLATDENCRCRGAGSAVFAACMDYAVAHGARKLMLVTNHILTPALRLYEKFGFKSVPLVSCEYERIDRQYEYEVS